MKMSVTTDNTTDAAETEGELDTNALDEAEKAEPAEAEDQQRARRRWPRRLLLSASVMVVVAALALSAVLGWLWWQQRALTEAGEQAQQAAVAYAQILTSIDSSKVDENFNQVLDGATGEFKDMYSQSSTQLRQLLVDNKASAHGVVVESAIQSTSKNKVVVLLFVDQSVSNATAPDPRIDRSRIKMTMEFVDGRWRASQVALP
jgi:Mce-associated membrane protein